jgi:hypothetical protein
MASPRMNGLLPFVGTGVAGRHPIAQDRRIESAAAPAATTSARAPAPFIERIDVGADVFVRSKPASGETPVRTPRGRGLRVAGLRVVASVAVLLVTICLVCRFGDTPSVPSLLPIEPGRVRPADVGIALSVLGGLMAIVAVIFGLANRARPRRQTR